ncbi:MAG: GAF domain-containing protein [Buchananella hordeovulneris]|nr:GAF domain-containing protein [Buchananella hordeovulneris]
MAKQTECRSVLHAALSLVGSLDADDVLTSYLSSACELTGADCAVLGVLDNHGETTQVLHFGLSPERAAQINSADLSLTRPATEYGAKAAHPELPDAFAIHNEEASAQIIGLPAWSRPLRNHLVAVLRIQDKVVARLILCNKEDGFSEEDGRRVRDLSAATAVALENARQYAASLNRHRWIEASQAISTMLLQGSEEEEALELIAHKVREAAEADTALIVLPSLGDSWVCEIAAGYGTEELIGIVFPPNGRAVSALRAGAGMVVDSLARARTLRVPQLGQFGPALYAPLMARGKGTGVLILLRNRGRKEFAREDLEMAESFAAQAALALEIAASRHNEDRAALLDERARIGRDLHDLAIQQLFASGMQLEAARSRIAAGERDDAAVVALLDGVLSSVDDSVRQIRAIVRSLKEPDENVDLTERLRREASLARTALGFAPSLVVCLDGVSLASLEDPGEAAVQLSGRVDHDLADDVVAVVREGMSNAARHAHCTSLQVRVDVRGQGARGAVMVSVIDDGVGVPNDRTRNSGLENLAARARRHRGTFSIGRAETGIGTHLSWTAPLV